MKAVNSQGSISKELIRLPYKGLTKAMVYCTGIPPKLYLAESFQARAHTLSNC